MAQQESGNRTEPATPRKLREARKRGEIPKSRELTATLLLAFLVVQAGLLCDYAAGQITALTLESLVSTGLPFGAQLDRLGKQAIAVTLSLSALLLIPGAVFALLVEFLQAGPVFALVKLAPRFSHIDPIAGFKRLFGIDNAVEVLKNVGKTLALFVIGAGVIHSMIAELLPLLRASPAVLIDASRALLARLLIWTLGVFLLLMVLDLFYQRKRFASRMKMSVRDIRREHKDNEGDPTVKHQRRQLHQEYAEQHATEAAGRATVLVVNPHHVAVAIDYDKHRQRVPRVLAIGEDTIALAMREAAFRRQVPVLRNERLARSLRDRLDEGDCIPRELFDIVAEVIHWAERTRIELARQCGATVSGTAGAPLAVPGEDLTDYPLGAPGLCGYPVTDSSSCGP